jgi:hypothetical protein
MGNCGYFLCPVCGFINIVSQHERFLELVHDIATSGYATKEGKLGSYIRRAIDGAIYFKK